MLGLPYSISSSFILTVGIILAYSHRSHDCEIRNRRRNNPNNNISTQLSLESIVNLKMLTFLAFNRKIATAIPLLVSCLLYPVYLPFAGLMEFTKTYVPVALTKYNDRRERGAHNLATVGVVFDMTLLGYCNLVWLFFICRLLLHLLIFAWQKVGS